MRKYFLTGFRYFVYIQITILITMFTAPVIEGPLAATIATITDNPKPIQKITYIVIPLLMEASILFVFMNYYEGTRKTSKEIFFSCFFAFVFHFALAVVLQFNGVYAGVSISYIASLITGITDVYKVPFYINALVFLFLCIPRFGAIIGGLHMTPKKKK